MNKIYISQYELRHYASPYYDPVKAHEYYEKHKQLKGRTEGRTLTDQGKEAKLYVTEQIKKAKKASSEKAKSDIEQAKKEHEASMKTNRHRAEIDSLQNELLSMSKDELKRKGPLYKNKIAKLKKSNAKEKEKMRESYSNKIKSIRENNKAKQEELSNTLKSELEKMLLDPVTGKSSKKSKNESSGPVKATSADAQARIKKNYEMIKKNNKNKEDKSK